MCRDVPQNDLHSFVINKIQKKASQIRLHKKKFNDVMLTFSNMTPHSSDAKWRKMVTFKGIVQFPLLPGCNTHVWMLQYVLKLIECRMLVAIL